MDIGSIIDIFSTGGVASIVGAIGGYFAKKKELEFFIAQTKAKMDMARLRLSEVKMEQDHEMALFGKQMERAELEGEIASDIKAGDAFIESMKNASKPTGIMWVDAWRGIMRPGITTFLLMTVVVLMWSLWDNVGGIDSFSVVEQIGIFKHIVMQMVFLTVMCVSWWFAARHSTPKTK